MHFLVLLLFFSQIIWSADLCDSRIQEPTPLDPKAPLLSFSESDTIPFIRDWSHKLLVLPLGLLDAAHVLESKNFNRGLDSNFYSLQFVLKAENSKEWMLSIQTHRISCLEVFAMMEGKWKRLVSSNSAFQLGYAIPQLSNIPLQIQVQQLHGVLRLPMVLEHRERSVQKQNLLGITMGILGGISALAIIILIIAYLKMHQVDFLFYASYLGFSFIWLLFESGIGNYFLDHLAFWGNGQVQKAFAGFTIVSIANFLYTQFSFKKEAWHKLFIGFNLLYLGSLLINLLDYFRFSWVATLNGLFAHFYIFTNFSAILITLPFVLILRDAFRKSRTAMVLLGVQLPALISMFFSLYKAAGQFDSSWSSSQLLVFVLIWEGFWLSVFIGYRVYCIYQQNIQLDLDLKRNAQQNKLEIKAELENLRDELHANIHDEVQQWVTALGLFLHQSKSQFEVKQFQIMNDSILGLKKSLRNALDIVNRDDYFSLQSFIKEIATLFNEGSGVRFVYEIQGQGLSVNRELELKKIFLELLNNSLKHSLPQEIQVQYLIMESKGVFSFIDNGIPMDESLSKQNQGAGRTNILLRCERIKGVYEYSQTEIYSNKHLISFASSTF